MSDVSVPTKIRMKQGVVFAMDVKIRFLKSRIEKVLMVLRRVLRILYLAKKPNG